MTAGSGWIAAVVTLPLAGAVLTLLVGRRGASIVGVLTAALTTAATVALVAVVAGEGMQRLAVGGWAVPLGIELRADGLAAAMLLMTASVGCGITLYARRYFDAGAHDADSLYWPVWLLLWGAMNALYLSGDIFNIYVTLELLGLAAVSLIVLAGPAAIAPALRYLLYALLGSMLYLLGVALMFAQFETLDLLQLQQNMQPGVTVAVAGALMTIGLLVKTAIFPLHFWLPSAHAYAPAPVSAALSALVVKAGYYLLLRLWLELYAVLPAAASMQTLLAALGAAAVLWGGIQALRQTGLKAMIAYSTVAQLGYLMLALPLAATSRIALSAAVLLAASHAAAKAAMFVAAGALRTAYRHDQIAGLAGYAGHMPVTAAALALASVSLIGLPPSGGFTGKFMLVEAALDAGAWWIVAVVLAGSLIAAAYLLAALAPAFADAPTAGAVAARAPQTPQFVALALALLAVALMAAGSVLPTLLAVEMVA